jgi:hypothetical protein
MAKQDTFNGVGRLHHQEINLELGALTADEVIGLWQAIYPEQTIEQNGNVFLIYWEGKTNLRQQRNSMNPIIQPGKIVMMPEKEYHTEPTFEKADYQADKTNDGVGEITEGTEGVVEEE